MNGITYKTSLYKLYSSKLFGENEELVYEIDNLEQRHIEDCIYDIHKILLHNKLAGKISGKFVIRVFEKKGIQGDYLKIREKWINLNEF